LAVVCVVQPPIQGYLNRDGANSGVLSGGHAANFGRAGHLTINLYRAELALDMSHIRIGPAQDLYVGAARHRPVLRDDTENLVGNLLCAYDPIARFTALRAACTSAALAPRRAPALSASVAMMPKVTVHVAITIVATLIAVALVRLSFISDTEFRVRSRKKRQTREQNRVDLHK